MKIGAQNQNNAHAEDAMQNWNSHGCVMSSFQGLSLTSFWG